MRLSLLTLLVLALTAAPARADDVDVEVVTGVLEGQEPPALVVAVNRALSTLAVELVRQDGVKVARSFGPTASGQTVRVPLPAPRGRWRYDGKLAVRFSNGSAGELPLRFEVEVLAPLEVTVDPASVDLTRGALSVQLSRPAGRCEHVIELDGKQDRRGATRFAGEPAGTPLPLRLPIAADDVVLLVTLTCYDTAGTSGGRRLSPWKLDVPHEEVNFASGQSRIEPSEQGKLDRAYEDILTAVRRYGDRITIKLYILGHTDTVGDAAANQQLSLDRARAIASYLQKRGIEVPIAYAGLGETALLVGTPDETDEARNRRAQYILAVEPPLAAGWRSL